jgi:transcription-repair coupling factor (superfamily II helicase)
MPSSSRLWRICVSSSRLEGLSDAAADRAILPFPSHEVDPYRGMAPHVGVTSARARALHALATGTTRVVVASAAALLPRVSAPPRLLGASMDLRPGQDIAPTDLAELLVDAGYSREDPADEHGEFAVRGGILDVFRPASRSPSGSISSRHHRVAAHLRPQRSGPSRRIS